MTFGICFKQHFDTRYLLFYNPSPPRMFLSLDLLSEYRIQHGASGPLYVTSSYSTWIFCRGVSDFATDCPCDVWCRGLNTCLLNLGPPFGNRFLNTSWAVGLTYWIVCFHLSLYFDICNNICLDTSYHFYPAALKGSGVLSYPERAGGRAAGQTSPVNTLTSIIFHGSFSNLARTFITLRSRTSSIMEVLPH